MTSRTVQYLLDADWHVVIAEQLAAFPTAAALVVEPAVLGQYDCELGRPCNAAAHGYTRLADVEAYCIAYHDTAALWVEIVTGKNDELDAINAETEDYMESLLDEEWHSRGMW